MFAVILNQQTNKQVTDKTALALHSVDKAALLTRIAHCSAYQLLVAGVFNGKFTAMQGLNHDQKIES